MRVGAFQRPAWFQPANDIEPPVVALVDGVARRFDERFGAERHGHVEAAADFDAEETRRHHAGNSEGLGIKPDRATDD